MPESSFNYRWFSQDFFEKCELFSYFSLQNVNIIISRIAFLAMIWIVIFLLYAIFFYLHKRITIKDHNYLISIEYGDIFKKKNCKRVINFDECFTTKLGDKTADINQQSICGQYLKLHPNLDMQQLITDAAVLPARGKSKYQGSPRYDSGIIVPNGDDLLMAFAKLDKNGKGRFFSRDEYLECLNLLWQELENHYSEKDVCVPILGAGTTAFDGCSGISIPKQDLLDMMIWSYRLSSHKIKPPHKLCIICKKSSDFSINNIYNQL